MKFQAHQDLTRNLQQSVFYSPKLKKAYMTIVGREALKLEIMAAGEDNFDKRVTSIDASKEFHLVGLTPGFAPRLYNNTIVFAERLPKRQWHFGWGPGNTRLCSLEVFHDKKPEAGLSSIQFNRDWWGDNGFIGRCWTGGFRTLKGVLEDGKGALSPTLAIDGNFLINFSGIIGEVKGRNMSIYQDYYNSFLVRELRDLGAEDVKEIPNA